MPVSIVSNNIAMPDRRKLVENAVLEGIGSQPGTWQVSIYEPQDRAEYAVTVEGPEGFRWSHSFCGPSEQTPDFIRDATRHVVASGRFK